MNQKNISGPNDFSSLGLAPALLEVIAELGFTQMTPIQAQSIPILLEGHDLVGQSKTGSGKTAAFGLPILQNLRITKRQLQALILCPTRELCAQVTREIRRLGRRFPGLSVISLAGGESVRPQITSMENGVHIAVGTPGRLLDHIKRETLDLSQLRCVVLDEADRMLDMGFRDDMEAILGEAPKNRQTVFFSATFPRSIEAMSEAFQRQPKLVSIQEAEHDTAKIEQVVYECSPEQKLQNLQGILQLHQPEAAIVFCNHKITVTELTAALSQAGASAAGLHGDLEQLDRDRVMAKLRNRSIRVLVATDVAARGIDVAGLDLVINYDLPLKPDTYVHRIGRTGRAGKTGLAISLASPRESRKLQIIEEFTGESFTRDRLEIRTQPTHKAKAIDLYQAAEMVTLSIGGGRKDKLRPGDILGALTGEAGGLKSEDIGKIEIHDRLAYVALNKSIAKHALECLREGRIKGRKFAIEWLK
ncbi:MAG: ATP-dependent RNA helicase DbpA [Proteobacteria bacterium]|nr:ATP-dependent RNA helicase DbpA [Pseudomonadota bacterium]